jgi:cyclopropane-fatty-acyl-phospholipid synthase
MSSPIASPSETAGSPLSLGWIDRTTRRAVLGRFDRLRFGRLELTDPVGSRLFEGSEPGPSARVTVRDPAFYTTLAARGHVGAGESYIEGGWQADDLVALIRLMALNDELSVDLEFGAERLAAPLLKLRHALRRNNRRGSRKNIAEHYDLSNEFFGLWLDPTMTYSSAVFERDEMTLEQAQVAKLDRLCRKLQLGPDDHLLEIGTGWGSMAIHAASRYGCRVTTTTISAEQRRLALERIRERGLEDRIEVLLSDYRDLSGQYDKLVSIEMIEAVGHHYYGTFFETCARLLKPAGLMAMQAITIQDRFYERARKTVDYIKRHIFPGSCIPSVSVLAAAAASRSDLTLTHLEDITPHYARTLREWRERCMERSDEIRALGFDDRFLRMWEFYLAYCEGGFTERHIGDVQMLFAKPMNRRPGWLLDRERMGPATDGPPDSGTPR